VSELRDVARSEGALRSGVADRLSKLVALQYSGNAKVALLVETPAPGRHVARAQVEVVAGRGFAGDHARKSFYKGALVPGREVTAVAQEVLQALDVTPLVVGDNLITEGLDLGRLEPGDRLYVGTAVLVRSDREHRPCTVFRDRTSPEAFAAISQDRYRGALFIVETGGTIRQGDVLRVQAPGG
jgi:MOSC domain-containing protein YiiM